MHRIRSPQIGSATTSRFGNGRQGLHALEIGSYEGRSALWMLENVLTDTSCTLTCIDIFSNTNFIQNTAAFRDRLTYIIGDSRVVLRSHFERKEQFDLIYIDGNHAACNVLEDIVLSFPLLKTGGTERQHI